MCTCDARCNWLTECQLPPSPIKTKKYHNSIRENYDMGTLKQQLKELLQMNKHPTYQTVKHTLSVLKLVNIPRNGQPCVIENETRQLFRAHHWLARIKRSLIWHAPQSTLLVTSRRAGRWGWDEVETHHRGRGGFDRWLYHHQGLSRSRQGTAREGVILSCTRDSVWHRLLTLKYQQWWQSSRVCKIYQTIKCQLTLMQYQVSLLS